MFEPDYSEAYYRDGVLQIILKIAEQEYQAASCHDGCPYLYVRERCKAFIFPEPLFLCLFSFVVRALFLVPV